MRERHFAVYLPPETSATSKPPDDIVFVGFSWPYFNRVRHALAQRLEAYPALPLRTVVEGRHLRLTSATHARPRLAGQYLLFDTARAIDTVDDLLAGLGRVF